MEEFHELKKHEFLESLLAIAVWSFEMDVKKIKKIRITQPT